MIPARIQPSCGTLLSALLHQDGNAWNTLLTSVETVGTRYRWLGTSAAGRPPIQSYSHEQRYRATGEIRYRVDTAGVIGDPYAGPRPWLTPLALFHPKGWKEIRMRVMDVAKDVYALYTFRKHIDGFKLRTVKQDALEIYRTVCQASAIGDQDTIRKLATPEVLKQIKKEISTRVAGGYHTVHWSLMPSGGQVKFLRARVLGMPGNKFTPSFAQCTLLFRNKQKFAAYNAKGNLIAGNEEKEVDVEDFWVFERLLQKDTPTSRWRIAARLSLTKT